ncbi:L-ascorbate metabolism protein UlaG (beta-lactamase superfamily) [Motilibacter peucedani]|uniref:L-ascorbate metabolism protein UlaG (Beta-lactamase superfamily) n=1 Tax=Motilibacter peucedani TaxID=598650 RepID=A0A420XT06_9ACTN|nr:MBL fold metallo-hydrolase [Motilibacter peucedani]RKS79972.1 L-ascorbate metabolism protein UlaG (beta-lactamase superfamily) [Motilibacter peucedani]
MQITKLGHSCLLVEDEGTRLLVDPGAFSQGYDDLTGLDGVLVTHQHFDHLATDRLKAVLAANPSATLVVDPGTAGVLEEAGVPGAQVFTDGDTTTLGGLEVRGFGKDHALFHPEADLIPNTGYLIGGRLFHPGDSLAVPGFDVEVLALPVVAPWSKISETVDFTRAVAARVTFPIHDAIIVEAAQGVFDGTVQGLGAQGRTYSRIDGEPLTV